MPNTPLHLTAPGPLARAAGERQTVADMADRPRYKAAWIRLLIGTLVTVTCAAIVVWSARSYGRSIGFAFGVNFEGDWSS